MLHVRKARVTFGAVFVFDPQAALPADATIGNGFCKGARLQHIHHGGWRSSGRVIATCAFKRVFPLSRLKALTQNDKAQRLDRAIMEEGHHSDASSKCDSSDSPCPKEEVERLLRIVAFPDGHSSEELITAIAALVRLKGITMETLRDTCIGSYIRDLCDHSSEQVSSLLTRLLLRRTDVEIPDLDVHGQILTPILPSAYVHVCEGCVPFLMHMSARTMGRVRQSVY
ncbi:hypothetical protein KP509_26G065400 [Ceratopteris richardii]|uniref:Uncharacterized protein n=1 Tax=Ceratopteris richardii TaxID=49495 RepID=A0A8T2RNQ4_CERRI|nr:hypothetical protein KP509_26G065400 [Ceratopteris richardii]